MRFRPLRAAIDRLGLRLLVLTLSIAWFGHLWGIGMPALLAGAALSIMLCIALSGGYRRHAQKREEALRRRIGGELALESLMLASPREAHFRCALMLAEKYPLKLETITDFGLFCKYQTSEALVCFICAAPGASVSATALIPCIRGALSRDCKHCIICTTGTFSADAQHFSRLQSVSIRLFDRAALLELAGTLSPATDEQLTSLARRKRGIPLRSLLLQAVDRRKARRYMACGLSLLLVYLLTGLKWYPIPGLACMVLAAACRANHPVPDCL